LTSHQPSQDSERGALDRSFARGVLWTGIARFGTQIVSWASFLLIARLLGPTELGIVAASSAVVGFVALVSEFGLGSAIIAKQELGEEEIGQLAAVSALLALAAWTVCAVIAWPVSVAMRVEPLRYVLPVVGLTTALTTFNAVPLAVLRREMAFRRASQFEVVKAVVQALGALALVLAGLGFWSLILAELTATAVLALLLLRASRVRIRLPDWTRLTTALQFSREVLVSRAAWYAYSNADFAVVSRRLGTSALGDYSMAWTLATLPVEKIATLLWAVMPSVLARVKDNLVELRRYVMLLFEALAFILMPVCAGIALVADNLVFVVLGPKWVGAIDLIRALALFAVVKSVAPISSQVLISIGNARAARNQSLWGLAVMPLAFIIASRWGAVAVALAWTAVYPVLVLFQIAEAAHAVDLHLRDILKRIMPALLGTALMAVVVVGVRFGMGQLDLYGWPRLGASVVAGACTYFAFVWLTARDRVRTVLAIRQTLR